MYIKYIYVHFMTKKELVMDMHIFKHILLTLQHREHVETEKINHF